MEKEKLEKGLIQVYTGNAKGKSTASFGLALRAAGHGFKVVIIQFMKTGSFYGEITSFKRLAPEIEIYSYGKEGFVHRRGVTEEDIALAHKALAHAEKVMLSPDTDILILDEINNALYFQLLTIQEVISLLDKKPEQVEIVLTGRNAPEEILERAHLVTEMKEIKHPFHQGINSRKGIEY
ncbi:cob(I)yrinic acid a,c-diamide adenosyltransferase [Candidatus Formimonas warabiya]|uniref:Cob(I)yrinic acid a,c-diamide adenosyltransferase n=1 Tax=Formimonas warabiya TaxID=1761012 RepID=A0A3G1L138_FORW1|nr:cob(I)yrinic acid a,c-diamide adenosyltransferase [Candidatus Formimonas warabiya]ATW28354.1 cob(I)yrinic acid a,c-diamide adenosyltransferase [Candidatus Formimonas warabiya]